MAAHVLTVSPQPHALKTGMPGLLLAPSKEVTSLFEPVLLIGLSVSRGGEKTMLMRSGVQGPCGSVGVLQFFGQQSTYTLHDCPASAEGCERLSLQPCSSC